MLDMVSLMENTMFLDPSAKQSSVCDKISPRIEVYVRHTYLCLVFFKCFSWWYENVSLKDNYIISTSGPACRQVKLQNIVLKHVSVAKVQSEDEGYFE